MLTTAVFTTVFALVALLLLLGWMQHVREQRRLRQVRALAAVHAQILRVEQVESALPDCLRTPTLLRLLLLALDARLRTAARVDSGNPYVRKHAERVRHRLLEIDAIAPEPAPDRLKFNGLSQEKAEVILAALAEVRTIAVNLGDEASLSNDARHQVMMLVEFARAAVPLELLLQQAAMYQSVRNLAAGRKLLQRAADAIAASRDPTRLAAYEKVVAGRREQLEAEALRQQEQKEPASTPPRPAAENPLLRALDQQLSDSDADAVL